MFWLPHLTWFCNPSKKSVQLFHFNYYIITSTIIMWLCFLQMKGPAVLLQLKSTWEFGKVSKIITEFRFLLSYIITEEIVWGSTG